jgi:hypothetical protein
MIEDGIGEVIELAADALGELGPSDRDRRGRRRIGCWWQLFLYLAVPLIIWGVLNFAS